MVITQSDADQTLANDLHIIEKGILAALKRPASQGEFDAMVSLAFNIGLGAFRSSSVVRYFNRGQITLAANAFLAWDRAGGRVLPDLQRRRKAESIEFQFQGGENLRVENELAGVWA
jgi:lysozyme